MKWRRCTREQQTARSSRTAKMQASQISMMWLIALESKSTVKWTISIKKNPNQVTQNLSSLKVPLHLCLCLPRDARLLVGTGPELLDKTSVQILRPLG